MIRKDTNLTDNGLIMAYKVSLSKTFELVYSDLD